MMFLATIVGTPRSHFKVGSMDLFLTYQLLSWKVKSFETEFRTVLALGCGQKIF